MNVICKSLTVVSCLLFTQSSHAGIEAWKLGGAAAVNPPLAAAPVSDLALSTNQPALIAADTPAARVESAAGQRGNGVNPAKSLPLLASLELSPAAFMANLNRSGDQPLRVLNGNQTNNPLSGADQATPEPGGLVLLSVIMGLAWFFQNNSRHHRQTRKWAA